MDWNKISLILKERLTTHYKGKIKGEKKKNLKNSSILTQEKLLFYLQECIMFSCYYEFFIKDIYYSYFFIYLLIYFYDLIYDFMVFSSFQWINSFEEESPCLLLMFEYFILQTIFFYCRYVFMIFFNVNVHSYYFAGQRIQKKCDKMKR